MSVNPPPFVIENREQLLGLLAEAAEMAKIRTDFVRGGAAKFFMDGVWESYTAFNVHPYADDPDVKVEPIFTLEQFTRLAAVCDEMGLQIAVHCCGDGAVRQTLDGYEAIQQRNGKRDSRHRVEHIEVCQPEDMPRFKQLGVIASMQPTHATSDMPWAQERLGPQRIVGAYAWRQLRDSGARLALGSDFPVESVDPRLGLYSAVSRADGEGKPAGGWFPDEKLTAYEALRGFTLDAAYAGFGEHELGSLEAGKRADFVVLAEVPLAVPDKALRTLTVLATYVDGKPVYAVKQ